MVITAYRAYRRESHIQKSTSCLLHSCLSFPLGWTIFTLFITTCLPPWELTCSLCVCLYTCVCSCEFQSQRPTLSAIIQELSPWFLRQGLSFSLVWSFRRRLRIWLASSRNSCPCLPTDGAARMHHYSRLFSTGSGDQTWVVLLLKPHFTAGLSPQLYGVLLFTAFHSPRRASGWCSINISCLTGS